MHDRQGVIAPWYGGLNGPCDWRVRIAAETLKRYPWTSRSNAIAAYPAYVFSGFWQIRSNGVITPRDPGDWGNGDLSQRATSVLHGLVDYYRYSGDAAAHPRRLVGGDRPAGVALPLPRTVFKLARNFGLPSRGHPAPPRRPRRQP